MDSNLWINLLQPASSDLSLQSLLLSHLADLATHCGVLSVLGAVHLNWLDWQAVEIRNGVFYSSLIAIIQLVTYKSDTVTHNISMFELARNITCHGLIDINQIDYYFRMTLFLLFYKMLILTAVYVKARHCARFYFHLFDHQSSG